MNMKKIVRHLLRNITLALLFCTGIPYLHFLYRRKKNGPLFRVITFHDIEPQEEGRFASCIAFLVKHFHIVSPQDILEKNFSLSEINILITFDDGYKSWREVALPVLQKHHIQSVCFVSSGFVDTAGDDTAAWEYTQHNLVLTRPRAPLSWEGVVALQQGGQEIGGHTKHHARLSAISKQQQESEVLEDKMRIEKKISSPLRFFAYPFGAESDIGAHTKNIVREAGFLAAFTTIRGFNTLDTDLMGLHRDLIDPEIPLSVIKVWMYGSYDFFA